MAHNWLKKETLESRRTDEQKPKTLKTWELFSLAEGQTRRVIKKLPDKARKGKICWWKKPRTGKGEPGEGAEYREVACAPGRNSH